MGEILSKLRDGLSGEGDQDKQQQQLSVLMKMADSVLDTFQLQLQEQVLEVQLLS